MVVDLTHNIEPSMQAYPGDEPVFSKDQSITVEEDGFSVQVLHIGTHAGTHIDAPSHCVTGAPAIHEVDLSVLVGPALVVDVTGLNPREEITLAHLEKYQPEDQLSSGQFRIVLFHTGWSQYWKTPKYTEHPYLTTDVVRRLLDLGVRVIGIDTLSVDRTASDGEHAINSFPVHHTVLEAGNYLVENLNNLAAIQSGSFVVSFLPLKVVGGDGSPIRAVAWKAGLH